MAKLKTDKTIRPRQSFFWQLLKSHMTISLVGIVSLFIALSVIFMQTANMRILTANVIPVVQSSSSVLRGVQHSLASMRGWVSLKDESFVSDWYKIWGDEIHPFLSELQLVGAEIELPAFEGRMTQLLKLLAELEESQWFVLEVAQTPGNEPSKVRYQLEIEPIFQVIDQMFNGLHDDNGRLPECFKGQDVELLYHMNLSFNTARDMLEKIIYRGEVGLAEQCLNQFQEVKNNLAELLSFTGHGARAQNILLAMKGEVNFLINGAEAVIELRKSSNWNVAQYLMETETMPLAHKTMTVIEEIVDANENLLTRRSVIMNRTGIIAAIGLSLLFILKIFTAVVVSRKSAVNLSRPVTSLVYAAEQLASGQLHEDIEKFSDDEFGDLTTSFNKMRRKLQKTQRQLVLQEKLAAIGKLAGSVAHDIRNPLGAISNSIYFLNIKCSAEADEKIKKHIAIMDREIKRATEIINDLMDFSRENKPLFLKGDINQFVKKYVGSLTLPENIVLDTVFDDNLPLISFDSSQLRRVIDNITTNAIQAMPDGGKLQILTKGKGQDVNVEIIDQGIGIEPDDMANIFEPLFTTKPKGVGLGLSISHSFVEKHGGTILVQSEVGRGAHFIVSLPNQAVGDSNA